MFSLSQLENQIFLLTFDNKYDLTMTFLRYQEFYEFDNFNIIDFMEHYSKTKGNGVFSYPNDWSGFYLPSESIREVWKTGIPDPNKYDTLMKTVYKDCEKASNSDCFCIIGIVDGDLKTLQHEMAHALYHINKSYRSKMNKAIKSLKSNHYKILHDTLLKMHYTKEAIDDEIQAYCATGLPREMATALRCKKAPYTKICKPFIEIFGEYHG